MFALMILNLCTGYAPLYLSDIFTGTADQGILSLRLSRVFSAMLAGAAVPPAGFLLQEYFRNPLAGPSVLGISSAAGLGVACTIFLVDLAAVSAFLQAGILAVSSFAGSMTALLLLLFFASASRSREHIIIAGFLLSAFCGAAISVMQLYSDNQSLRNYILWSMGSNVMPTELQLVLLLILTVFGLCLGFRAVRPLQGSLLGLGYAVSFGISLDRLRWLIIICSAILSSAVTAFLGPILFIGIIVPHFCRLMYPPVRLYHQFLLNILVGMVVMLLLSLLSEIFALPVNIFSSVVGVPVILLMMIRTAKHLPS